MRTPTMPAPMMILSLLEEPIEGFAVADGVGTLVAVGAGDASVGFVSRGVVEIMGVRERDVVEGGPCLAAIGAAMAWEASFLFPLR